MASLSVIGRGGQGARSFWTCLGWSTGLLFLLARSLWSENEEFVKGQLLWGEGRRHRTNINQVSRIIDQCRSVTKVGSCCPFLKQVPRFVFSPLRFNLYRLQRQTDWRENIHYVFRSWFRSAACSWPCSLFLAAGTIPGICLIRVDTKIQQFIM